MRLLATYNRAVTGRKGKQRLPLWSDRLWDPVRARPAGTQHEQASARVIDASEYAAERTAYSALHPSAAL